MEQSSIIIDSIYRNAFSDITADTGIIIIIIILINVIITITIIIITIRPITLLLITL